MSNTTSETFTFDLTGGRLALDFVNTVGGMRWENGKERLHAYADLVAFARQTGAIEDAAARALAAEARRRPEDAARVLAAAKDVREALYRTFLATANEGEPAAADLARIDAAVREALAHRRLLRSGASFRLGFEDGALEAPLWPVYAAAADLLTDAEDLARVRVCGLYDSGECSWLFVDETRARTRRWCSMQDCGNRAKARRHRAKAKGEAPSRHPHE